MNGDVGPIMTEMHSNLKEELLVIRRCRAHTGMHSNSEEQNGGNFSSFCMGSVVVSGFLCEEF